MIKCLSIREGCALFNCDQRSINFLCGLEIIPASLKYPGIHVLSVTNTHISPGEGVAIEAAYREKSQLSDERVKVEIVAPPSSNDGVARDDAQQALNAYIVGRDCCDFF
ncbi:MAG TPA: hypothetical protein PKA63_14415 [Oligoflexia bacterium]|nr:hypothetical protein [Oligoflexia bacterium]HMP49859.1 hypothetical protein [Oligoflexia bacterium]